MGIKSRRKLLKIGTSKGITLPAALTFGETSTLAANRIIIIDPRGKISEDRLLNFLERCVEPQFWPFFRDILAESSEEKRES